jgi:hypothetical protein
MMEIFSFEVGNREGEEGGAGIKGTTWKTCSISSRLWYFRIK